MDNIDIKSLNILIATPCYNGQLYASYTESLLNTTNIFTNLGIRYNVHFIKNQIVTRARSMLAHIFLDENNNYTHLMFIDADVVWNPEHIFFLLQHKKEFLIGIYPNKAYDDNYNLKPSSKIKSNTVLNNLIEVEHAATGFMLLTKSVFEKIKKYIIFLIVML